MYFHFFLPNKSSLIQPNEILINKSKMYVSAHEKSVVGGLGDLELSDNGGKSPAVIYTPWGLFISSLLSVFHALIYILETCF